MMTQSLIEGDGFKSVLYFSVPMIAGAIIEQFYSSADSIIAGNFIGSDALAAIGATGTVIYFIFSLSSGLANGSCVIIAQIFGEGAEDKLRKAIVSALYYTAGCMILVSLLGGLFVSTILNALNVPKDIFYLSVDYLKIYVSFSFGQILFSNVSAMLRALGDSKTPLYFLVSCTILNIILDLIFIVVFKFGVKGVAIATVISQAISGLCCIIYAIDRFPAFRITIDDLKPSAECILSVAKIGVPMGLYSSVLSVGDMLLSGIINSYGTTVVASFSAANRIHQFSIIPFFNYSLAFSTFTAQNYGAGRYKRIKDTLYKSIVFLLIISFSMAVIISLLKTALMTLFISNADYNYKEIISIGEDFLAFVPFFYFALAIIWLFNYAIRGMGKSLIPICSGAIELVSKIYVPYILGLRYGYIGVWYGFPVCWVLGVVPSMIYLERWCKRVENEKR